MPKAESTRSEMICELAEVAAVQVLQAETMEDVRAMLSILAIAKGIRMHAELLVKYTEDELK